MPEDGGVTGTGAARQRRPTFQTLDNQTEIKMSVDLKAAGIINLEQLYLIAIANAMKAERLDVVLQDFENGAGRLWLTSPDTTVPHGGIEFKFERDIVHFGVMMRDERTMARAVKYAEGIDGFLEELAKFLRQNRLAHKRAA